ncbi:excinuclease ABC subunit C [Arthrobacter sp. TPD3018]|uniref:GIY-YIG nuclease family protein n=1 Tax=Bacteria TaxID=2 RepID=UPI000D5194B1|nr:MULTISPECIES: GIY-YIG nuclease family protein [Bacteria]PVE59040.1 excinuclease ABC subunit C [Sphingomonas sp. TPD3009]PVE60563.1 excinuclease ABC subunit C [Arthrobacter sp. TPD3018]PVE87239.1 excinuclease ABC subunit C [Sphingomonas melonis]
MGGWVYIMASKPHGMLYSGVTAHLAARVDQHRRDVGSAFCRRYGVRTLVYAEPYDRIEDAIAREKALKAWQRAWKVRLIETANPEWRDLFDTIA